MKQPVKGTKTEECNLGYEFRRDANFDYKHEEFSNLG